MLSVSHHFRKYFETILSLVIQQPLYVHNLWTTLFLSLDTIYRSTILDFCY